MGHVSNMRSPVVVRPFSRATNKIRRNKNEVAKQTVGIHDKFLRSMAVVIVIVTVICDIAS